MKSYSLGPIRNVSQGRSNEREKGGRKLSQQMPTIIPSDNFTKISDLSF